jgi:hypothetical protein
MLDYLVMQLTAADRKIATDMAYSSWWVRRASKRNPENERRILRIAEVVWQTCNRNSVTVNTQGTREVCQYALESQPDYAEIIKFAWLPLLLEIVLPILINIFLNLFLAKRLDQCPTNPS